MNHGLSRRTVLKTGAWSLPVVAAASAVPLASASTTPPTSGRAVVGGDAYDDPHVVSQVPIPTPFALAVSTSFTRQNPADFSVNGEPASRWAATTWTTTYTLPADAGYTLSNIVVVTPWAGNSPYTEPYANGCFAAQWDDASKRWLNGDPRLPSLVRPPEGHSEYATMLTDPTAAWGAATTTAPLESFAAVRPFLGTNDLVYTRIDGTTTTSHVADSSSVYTTRPLVLTLAPGESFTVIMRNVVEVAFVNGNRYHGYYAPAFVIADYTPTT